MNKVPEEFLSAYRLQACFNWRCYWPLSIPTENMIKIKIFFKFSEVVARRCSVKKLLLKISQNSQENICAMVSLPQAGTGVFLWILRNF